MKRQVRKPRMYQLTGENKDWLHVFNSTASKNQLKVVLTKCYTSSVSVFNNLLGPFIFINIKL